MPTMFRDEGGCLYGFDLFNENGLLFHFSPGTTFRSSMDPTVLDLRSATLGLVRIVKHTPLYFPNSKRGYVYDKK